MHSGKVSFWMVESNGGVALACCTGCWLEILGQRERNNLMRWILISFSLLLVLGGCASLKDKCVYLKLGKNARADITIGPYLIWTAL